MSYCFIHYHYFLPARLLHDQSGTQPSHDMQSFWTCYTSTRHLLAPSYCHADCQAGNTAVPIIKGLTFLCRRTHQIRWMQACHCWPHHPIIKSMSCLAPQQILLSLCNMVLRVPPRMTTSSGFASGYDDIKMATKCRFSSAVAVRLPGDAMVKSGQIHPTAIKANAGQHVIWN